MNWDMIGATGEWAGAIAVVVTLIYLSNQIKHARLATRQDTEQRRTELAQRLLLIPVQNGSLADLVATIDVSSGPLNAEPLAAEWGCSPGEAFRLQQYWTAWIGSWEEYYLNPHRDEQRWKTVEYRIPRLLAHGAAGSVWKLRKDIFAPDFVAYVDSLLKEFETDASR